jgi:hypothetical protein
VAWVASAGVHALVAVLVLRAGHRVERRTVPDAEIVELDVDLGPVQPPPVPRPVERTEGKRVSSAPRSRTPSAPADPSPLPSPRQAGRGDQNEAEREEPAKGGHDERARGPIDLSFGALRDDVKGQFATKPRSEDVLRARPHRLSVDELRADLERRQDAVANVEKGRVDPLMYDYLRGAKARFQTDAKRLADDLAVGGGATLRSWGRGYLNSVDAANRGELGARADAPREGGGDTRNEKSAGADVLGAYNEATRQAEAGAEERIAEVCLDVAAGRETTVALRRTSGNAALDRLAIESFTKAIAARPVPPDVRGGLACYELRISAFRIPPLPAISCGFDAGFTRPTCVWPFKKVTSVKGRLLSVEDPPAADGSPARASLLRKPR